MFRKDVTANKGQFRRRISDVGHDKRTFSATAGSTRVENSGQGRPMRGGIRL